MTPAEHIVACPVCALAQRIEAGPPGVAFECMRCGAFLGREPERDGLHLTAGGNQKIAAALAPVVLETIP